MRRRISREIKKEVVSKVQAGERVAELGEQDGISPKTIYNWLREDTGGEMIEAIYRHCRCYNCSRIHTALKMPPAVYAVQHFPDTCLHKLGA